MKITAIEIVGFGKWQQQKIEFHPENQLIYGDNEVGKSTIYQFIQAILFGFPAKGKRKRDYTPKNGGAFGGRLWFEHPVFGEVQVDRFKDKNKGQAIIYYNQQTGDEKMMQQLLHPLTKKLFQEVFTFQQEQLTAIDKLDEEGLQTSLLAIGVSGSQQLLNHRDQYFKDAQAIFRGKGTQPPLNQQVVAYQELQAKIVEKEQQQAVFQQVVTNLEQRQKELIELRGQIKTTQTTLNQVEEQQRNYPLYEELQGLAPQKVTTTISEEEQSQLETAFQEYTYLSSELQRLNKELAFQGETTEIPEEYHFYLKEEKKIQALLNQRYDIQQLLAEYDWMEQSFQQNRQEMVPMEVQWDWSSEFPPQLFFDSESAQILRQKSVSLHVDLQRAMTKQELIKEDIAAREENLTTFEEANPEMFSSKGEVTKPSKTAPLLGLGLAALMVIVSFFIAAPLKFVLLLAGVIVAGIGVKLLFGQKKDPLEEVKQQWQEKLSHLDYLNEQLQTAEQDVQQIQSQEQFLAQEVAQKSQENNLGKMNRIDLWTNHREDITRYLLLVSTNEELQNQLQENQQKIQNFDKQMAIFMTRLPFQGKGLAEKVAILQRFSEEMEKIRFTQEYQADSYTKQSIRELKEKQQALMNRIQPLLIAYQIRTLEEIPEVIQQVRKNQNQQTRSQELTTRLAGIYPEKTTLPELTAKEKGLKATLLEQEQRLQRLQEEEQEGLFQRQQLLTDGSLDELYQTRAALLTEIEELAVQWSGYQIAGQLLMDLLLELSEQQLPMLLKKATEYFKLLSDGHYISVQIDSGALATVTENHELFFIHELSTGTKDQLIMAVRFAFLALQSEQLLCPIIIDDGWLHYDHRRKYQLARLFAEFGKKQQVICFSSDQEMVSYYQELLQPVNYL